MREGIVLVVLTSMVPMVVAGWKTGVAVNPLVEALLLRRRERLGRAMDDSELMRSFSGTRMVARRLLLLGGFLLVWSAPIIWAAVAGLPGVLLFPLSIYGAVTAYVLTLLAAEGLSRLIDSPLALRSDAWRALGLTVGVTAFLVGFGVVAGLTGAGYEKMGSGPNIVLVLFLYSGVVFALVAAFDAWLRRRRGAG